MKTAEGELIDTTAGKELIKPTKIVSTTKSASKRADEGNSASID